MLHSYWVVFILTAVILNLSPGPDMIYLITQSMSSGKKAGFASILGLGTGALIHTLFVALGFSTILMTSILVFRILKIVGAGYLFFLGIKTLLSRESKTSKISEARKEITFKASYIDAVIIDVTNPKVAIFFMALLPQFYRKDGASEFIQFLNLGLIIVLIAFIIEGIIVILSDKIAIILKKRRTLSNIIDKSFGVILIGLSVKLVFEKQS